MTNFPERAMLASQDFVNQLQDSVAALAKIANALRENGGAAEIEALRAQAVPAINALVRALSTPASTDTADDQLRETLREMRDYYRAPQTPAETNRDA